ncbi:uncharacterized protein LOC106735899 [Tupaia chinensis]|uniref:uncharacterized protein LOC106735899 n=1 Tax=Tupaia chinensis TaxID=246437 RepID=UPI000FFC0CDB|nr:uncharacterized protein LOC106735899 [Tupaia chinensis]
MTLANAAPRLSQACGQEGRQGLPHWRDVAHRRGDVMPSRDPARKEVLGSCKLFGSCQNFKRRMVVLNSLRAILQASSCRWLWRSFQILRSTPVRRCSLYTCTYKTWNWTRISHPWEIPFQWCQQSRSQKTRMPLWNLGRLTLPA